MRGKKQIEWDFAFIDEGNKFTWNKNWVNFQLSIGGRFAYADCIIYIEVTPHTQTGGNPGYDT